jgi:hypothetical protein
MPYENVIEKLTEEDMFPVRLWDFESFCGTDIFNDHCVLVNGCNKMSPWTNGANHCIKTISRGEMYGQGPCNREITGQVLPDLGILGDGGELRI